MVKHKTCVFISGKGTNLKNLIHCSRDSSFPITISLVISNKKKAEGLNFAKIYKIPYVIIDTNFKNYEIKTLLFLKKHKISFICLAGFMKIISNNIIRSFEKKIINIHPSLLPKFKGLNTFNRVLSNKEKKTGCTVHYVTSKLDAGQIIVKKRFYLDSDENELTLKRKTQKLEHRAFPEAIIKTFRNS